MGTTSVDSRFSKFTKGVLAFFIVASFVLAALAHQASTTFQENLESSFAKQFTQQDQVLQSSRKFWQTTAYFNPFIDANIGIKKRLLPQLYDLDEQYRSMYFGKEKKILRGHVLAILKQLITISPFDTRYWLHLFSTSSNVNKDSEEFTWIVDRVYSLLKWNAKKTTPVARYCVREYLILEGSLATSCAKIILDVVSINNAKQLSRMLRADYKNLSIVSKELGLDIESSKL